MCIVHGTHRAPPSHITSQVQLGFDCPSVLARAVALLECRFYAVLDHTAGAAAAGAAPSRRVTPAVVDPQLPAGSALPAAVLHIVLEGVQVLAAAVLITQPRGSYTRSAVA